MIESVLPSQPHPQMEAMLSQRKAGKMQSLPYGSYVHHSFLHTVHYFTND